MRVASVLVSVLIGMSQVAIAAPETSLRPVARVLSDPIPTEPPVAQRAFVTKQRVDQHSDATEAPNSHLPPRAPAQTDATSEQVFATVSPQAIGRSIRPNARSNGMVRTIVAKRREIAKGSVCGDPAIQGEPVGFVRGNLSACAIEDAVRVRSVSGVSLSQHAVIDCQTAQAIRTWVETGLKSAIGSTGGGVVHIDVPAHFTCRTRNNQPGAQISEHGKGRAIDISGFRLRDGSEISLVRDWNRGDIGLKLRKMHQSACGIFGTVLGPDSNRFHKDHFHFDTARHRGGSFCR